MLPNPLHPAVVHFPVVLAFLLPLAILGALWTIRRGVRPRAAWSVPLMVAVALAGSAWAAVETGQDQAHRVERVVGEQPVESHEEMAEAFLTASAALAVVACLGLIGGRIGTAARVVTGVGAVALVAVAAQVGHSGGQLVYTHGAATAYTDSAATTADSAARALHRGGDDDETR